MKSSRRVSSISPNSFDPTTVSGHPRLLDPSRPPSVELVRDGPVVRKVTAVGVRYDDKVVFDALQAWWLIHRGERLAQWDLFSVVLSEALANRGGRLGGAAELWR